MIYIHNMILSNLNKMVMSLSKNIFYSINFPYFQKAHKIYIHNWMYIAIFWNTQHSEGTNIKSTFCIILNVCLHLLLSNETGADKKFHIFSLLEQSNFYIDETDSMDHKSKLLIF